MYEIVKECQNNYTAIKVTLYLQRDGSLKSSDSIQAVQCEQH